MRQVRAARRHDEERPRRDPAPSRLAYKLNRLFMRRWVKVFLRYGLPVLILVSAAAFWASDEDRVQAAKDRVAELRRQVEERPEFMVRMMAVEDASAAVSADVREVLSLDFPISSFDLDLADLRQRVEGLDAVAGASVRVRTGGVLEVQVVEREPVAVWRTGEGLELIDGEGHRVVGLSSRTERPELPLVVGLGADEAIAEALALYAASAPIRERLRGFVRVGERRWDVVLDHDQRVLLPETGALDAFQKVLALDKSQDLLARDISAVDFRIPARPVLRLGSSNIEGLLKIDFPD